MTRRGRFIAAVRAWLATAPAPRFTGCEAHFAARLGLDRPERFDRPDRL